METLHVSVYLLEVLEQDDLGGDELDKLAVVEDMTDTVDMRDLYTVGMLQGVDIDKAVGNILVVVRGDNCRVVDMVVDEDEPELVRLGKLAHGGLLDSNTIINFNVSNVYILCK